jgi:hypothetical protein
MHLLVPLPPKKQNNGPQELITAFLYIQIVIDKMQLCSLCMPSVSAALCGVTKLHILE